MKNVLMIGWELPPFNSGGLGVACFCLAQALTKKVNLYFALPKKVPLQDTPFPVIFADEATKILSGYNGAASDILVEVENYGPRLWQAIKKAKLKFDLIHAHDWLCAKAAIFLKKKLHLSAILHIHATEIERTGGCPNPTIYRIEQETFTQADSLITVSDLTAQIVTDYYKITPQKITAIPNGIDLKQDQVKDPIYFRQLKAKGYKLVLFVGRLVLQKGPDYFLQTLPQVKKFFKVKYIIVGSGEMFEQLVKTAKELQVLQDLIFTGFLRDKELWSIYQAADLLVAPSVFDPFGLVPLEGIKYKTPVIISKTTGLGSYLTHILKCDFWDTHKLAELIISLLKYPAAYRELSQNSYQELPKFNWGERAERVMKVYDKISSYSH